MPGVARPRFFYGYVIVLVSLLMLIVMHGANVTYGVFFGILQVELGASRAVISGASSLAFLVEGLFAVLSGSLTDRLGPRLIMIVSGIIMGLAYFLMARVETVWQLYLFFGIINGIGISGSNVTLLSTAARWFVKRRGLMSSLVKVGTGAGFLVMPIIATWLISSYGWRNAYLVIGALILVVVLTLARFLFRDPAQKGLKPYGVDEAGVSSELIGPQLSFRRASRTSQFWIVCGIYSIVILTTQSMLVHIVAYAVDAGIALATAAGTLSLIGAVSIAGRIIMGITGDRLGNRPALLICMGIMVTAIVWLQFAREVVPLYVFAVIYGLAHGGFFALMSPLVAGLFGTASHGIILGMLILISQGFGGIGPLATGYIFDLTNSYRIAFLIFLVTNLLGLLLAARLKPLKADGPGETGSKS